MEAIKIDVINVIGDNFGVEAEDGQKIFERIKSAFDDNKKVILSFQNIEVITTAFLNTAVGQLYKHYLEKKIDRELEVVDISESGRVSLNRVKETAKIYYNDPDYEKLIKKSIEDITEE